MKIDIHANNIELDKNLAELINKKVGKLSNYNPHIIDTAVYLHAEGPTTKEIHIKLNIKNQTLICKEKGETFEEALDLSVDKMKRQLERHKQK
jgi:putative sigma-54 modulation protein